MLPFVTSQFLQVFTQHSRLVYHLNSHTNQRLFECDLCHKKFNTAQVSSSFLLTYVAMKKTKSEFRLFAVRDDTQAESTRRPGEVAQVHVRVVRHAFQVQEPFAVSPETASNRRQSAAVQLQVLRPAFHHPCRAAGSQQHDSRR